METLTIDLRDAEDTTKECNRDFKFITLHNERKGLNGVLLLKGSGTPSVSALHIAEHIISACSFINAKMIPVSRRKFNCRRNGQGIQVNLK